LKLSPGVRMNVFDSVLLVLLGFLAVSVGFFFYLWKKSVGDHGNSILQLEKEHDLKAQLGQQETHSQIKVLESENKELRLQNTDLRSETTHLNSKIIGLTEARSKLESEIEQTKKHFNDQLAFVETAKEKL
jgi:predicted  nucleic acid-binding Zn-ribbon protein